MLNVIGDTSSKMFHSLRMLCVLVDNLPALKQIHFSSVKLDFSVLHQIIVNARSLEVVCAKCSMPLTFEFVRNLLSVKKHVKFIAASIECSTEEQTEWAVLLSNYAGTISIRHSIIESVRASLLWYPKSLYSMPNPSGQN